MKHPNFLKSVVASVLIFSAGGAGATETASFESPAESYSSEGGSASFDVSFDYTGSTLSTLGLSIVLPDGWSFASASGPNSPPIVPDPGTTANAEFAYFSVPANAINFTVTLDYAAGLTGDQSIGGTVLYKISGNSTNLTAALSPITLVAAVAPASAPSRNRPM
jgi:hypothetical protein